MADKILIRRGLFVDLPDLDSGEFGYATDRSSLYLGTAFADNILINPISATSSDGYTIDGYLNPARDNVHGLGTPTKRWKELSLGPNSLNIFAYPTDPGISNTAHFSVGIDNTGKLCVRQGNNVSAQWDGYYGFTAPLGISSLSGPLKLGNRFVNSSHILGTSDVSIGGQLGVSDFLWADNGVILANRKAIYFGSAASASASITTFSAVNSGHLAIGVGLTYKRTLVICENDDASTNLSHNTQTNPTMFIHAAAASPSGYLAFSFNNISGNIFTGGHYIHLGHLGNTPLVATSWGDLFVDGNIEVGGGLYSTGIVFAPTGVKIEDGAPGGNAIWFGTSFDSSIRYNTKHTPDAMQIAVGDDSKGLIISSADFPTLNTDFAHPLQTNPTIFLHSNDYTNITQYLSFTHNQTDGYIVSGFGGVVVSPHISTPPAGITLFAGQTTFAARANVMIVTADGAGNTIATITGGKAGMFLTLICRNANLAITDDATGSPDTVNLSAAFSSTANDTLTLVNDGTSWFETARAVN